MNTAWYRTFAGGGMSVDQFLYYLDGAKKIESMLKTHPGVLEEIQNTEFWNNYLLGKADPMNIAKGDLGIHTSLMDFRVNSPHLYAKVITNPSWKNTAL